MVDEPAVTLRRAPLAVAKIGTAMTARSYVQGDYDRSLTELLSKCELIGYVTTLVCIRSALGAARTALFQSVEDLYESFNSRSRDISWHRIVRRVRFLCRTGKRRGYWHGSVN